MNTSKPLFVLKKLTAAVLTAGLIVAAPGLGCWEVVANTVAGVQAVPVNAGIGSVAGAGFSRASAGGALQGAGLAVDGNALLNGALPSLAGPSVAVRTAAPRVGRAAKTPNGIVPAAEAFPLPVPLAKTAGLARSPAALSAKASAKTGAAVTALEGTRGALGRMKSGRVGPAAALSRLFDRSAARAGISTAEPVSANRSASSSLPGLRRSRSAVDERRDGPAAPKAAPAATPEAPKAVGMRRLLPFAAAGAAAALFGAPYLIAAAGPYLPAFLASGSIWSQISFASAGALLGLGAAQFELWREFPGKVFNGAREAAVTTFRFWARFGRIFSAVLTGGSTNDAMKAPLPANVFKYPVLAWPFVLVGYGTVPALAAAAVFGFQILPLSWLAGAAALAFGGAPVSFAAGFLFYALSTPVRAVLRGLKQVVVGFFPWVQSVLNFLSSAIRRAIPFLIGFLWGGVSAGGAGIAIGATTLARPAFENVVDARYAVAERSGEAAIRNFPAMVGLRLLQLAGLVSTAVLGLAGGALGLVLSVPYMFAHGMHRALKRSEIEGKTARLFKAWFDFVEDEDAVGELGQLHFAGASGPRAAIGLGGGLTRLLATAFLGLYLLPATALQAVVTFIRSWSRAIRFVRTGEKPEKAPASELPASNREDAGVASAATPAQAAKGGFLAPFILGTLGAAAGGAGAYFAFLTGAALFAWPTLAILGGAVFLGWAAGLALSVPSAFKGWLPAMWSEAKASGAASFRGWARAGLNTDAALRDARKDPALWRDAPWTVTGYPVLARAAALIGFVSTVPAFAAGALYRAAATPVRASWFGFLNLVERFIPFVKRMIRKFWKFLWNFIPFVFGFMWGGVKGLVFTAAHGAGLFAGPMFLRVVDPQDADYAPKTIPGMFAVRIVQGVAVVFGLAAGLVGGVAGLIYGLPYSFLTAMSQAAKWAGMDGRFGRFFRVWEKQTVGREIRKARPLGEPAFPGAGETITYWNGAVRAGNLLAFAAVSILSTIPVAAGILLRSAAEAYRLTRPGDPSRSADETAKELRVENEPVAQTREKNPVQAGKSYFGAGVAALFGLSGAAAGLYGGLVYAVPLLGLSGWWALAAYAGAALLGGAVGLMLSQPSAFRGWFGVVGRSTAESARIAVSFWGDAGGRFAGAVKGTSPDAKSRLALAHKGAGLLMGLVSGIAGFAYGAAVVPVRAALLGAKKVLLDLWPWIKRVFQTLRRIAKRFFPFVFGGIAGLFVGVIGSAMFGAVLLGRPYFKYVAAEDYETGTISRFLSAAALRVTAIVLGVILGVIGMAAGVLAALPYSLTLSPAMAFQLAGIKSRATTFFDLWNKGTLRAELRRNNELTNKFEFDEERENGELNPVHGWVRMANVVPATGAAMFLATITGYVSYFRSMWKAYKDLRSGKTVPDEAEYDDLGVARRTAGKGLRGASKWLSHLAGWGTMLGAAYLIVKSFWAGGIWTAVWQGVAASILAWPAGWLAGAVLGAVVGFGVGMLIWLSRQLEKAPPEAGK